MFSLHKPKGAPKGAPYMRATTTKSKKLRNSAKFSPKTTKFVSLTHAVLVSYSKLRAKTMNHEIAITVTGIEIIDITVVKMVEKSGFHNFLRSVRFVNWKSIIVF